MAAAAASTASAATGPGAPAPGIVAATMMNLATPDATPTVAPGPVATPGGHMAQLVRVTELANELTPNLDVSTPAEMIRLLRSTDAQLFGGYGGFPGVHDASMRTQIDAAIDVVAKAVGCGTGLVVSCGSGTSGRLAYLASRAFNLLLVATGRQPCFLHLAAGGNGTLIKAQEGAEDDPKLAARDVAAALSAYQPTFVVIVGISCSMSAAYVNAAVAEAIGKENAFPVFIGFNPVSDGASGAVAATPVVAHLAHSSPTEGVLLNPVIGPEPVAGSTRMKGGSMTKILLETIFAAGIEKAFPGTLSALPPPATPTMPDPVSCIFAGYEASIRTVYHHATTIEAIASAAATSLRAGGRVVYLGDGTAAILGLVDASECPPTYGAAFNDVRGFVEGGWTTLVHGLLNPSVPETPSSVDLEETKDSVYQIDLTTFVSSVMPALCPQDTVIMTGLDQISKTVLRLSDRIKASGATLASILVCSASQAPVLESSLSLQIVVNPFGIHETLPIFGELSLKLCLNAITTIAHVRKGTVYRNRMINLTVSNIKLFHRAVNVIATFSDVDVATATTCLLRSIYRTDDVTEAIVAKSVPEHVKAAFSMPFVVPLALLLAKQPALLVADALRAVAVEPVLRNLMASTAVAAGDH